MSFTVIPSIAVVFLCILICDAHHPPFGRRGEFLKAECSQASNNDSTQTNNCVQCFNDSRVEETQQTDQPPQGEPEDRFGPGRPGPGFGFRQNFDSTKLDECVKTYLGTDYTDCGNISSDQSSKITSIRILECIRHRFSELVGRQCASEVQDDDLREYFTCQRKAFFEG